MQSLPLLTQTAYAELMERSATADFQQAFAGEGAFTSKNIRGRTYWYFQEATANGRKQRYVGRESEAVLEQIKRHRRWQDDRRERRALVTALLRTAGVPQPKNEIGAVVEAFAKSGVFRRRGVLIGTVAYHVYAPMLGAKLPDAALGTDDIDIAQDRAVSVAIGDDAPPILTELQKIDPHFQAIPGIRTHHVVAYQSPRLRVDVLTSNRGVDSDKPVHLPALGSDALPLRFIDFLIFEPVPAVLLYGDGIYISVPAPTRYAIQKLIVAGRRQIGAAKAAKDLRQAESLLDALTHLQPSDLRDVWKEAWLRGKNWKEGMSNGLSKIAPHVRDRLLQSLGQTRSSVGLGAIRFDDDPPFHVFDRDIVALPGKIDGTRMLAGISREALDDHFGTDLLDAKGRVAVVRQRRSEIESMAALKYANWPIEDLEITLIKTADVEQLRHDLTNRSRTTTTTTTRKSK